MEGPTPVSALLHSATMVTAGIFLILRFSHFFEFSPMISKFMAITAILTCLFASFSAMGQYDIKKIIAYSTTSQLSYMLLSCSSSQYILALQHLFDHAFFKAVLFLGAGSIIHLMYGKQDIREFGFLFKSLPFTYLSFLIASFSLLGLPSTSGFYSKESIIEAIFLRTTFQEIISLFTCLSVSFSAYYSLQVICLTFYGLKNNTVKIYFDNSIFINIALLFLTLGGLIVGFCFFNFYTLPSSFFQNSFFFVNSYENHFVDDLN
jgi:NADH:ubiquinone oxidoreductase subunit 5 (subunit L)/multisubunit Na+/H+ antiporter MnhA subunit